MLAAILWARSDGYPVFGASFQEVLDGLANRASIILVPFPQHPAVDQLFDAYLDRDADVALPAPLAVPPHLLLIADPHVGLHSDSRNLLPPPPAPARRYIRGRAATTPLHWHGGWPVNVGGGRKIFFDPKKFDRCRGREKLSPVRRAKLPNDFNGLQVSIKTTPPRAP
jgi:hypothetical protein